MQPLNILFIFEAADVSNKGMLVNDVQPWNVEVMNLTADVSKKHTLVNDVQPWNVPNRFITPDVFAAITDTRLSLSLKALENPLAKPTLVKSHTLAAAVSTFCHVPVEPTPATVGS